MTVGAKALRQLRYRNVTARRMAYVDEATATRSSLCLPVVSSEFGVDG